MVIQAYYTLRLAVAYRKRLTVTANPEVGARSQVSGMRCEVSGAVPKT
jgi:hypothetical protein